MILLFLFQAATVYVVVRRLGFLKKRRFAGWATVGRTGLSALPVLAIPLIILGGFFSGVFTLYESGAVAAVVAIGHGDVRLRQHGAAPAARASWCWPGSRPGS